MIEASGKPPGAVPRTTAGAERWARRATPTPKATLTARRMRLVAKAARASRRQARRKLRRKRAPSAQAIRTWPAAPSGAGTVESGDPVTAKRIPTSIGPRSQARLTRARAKIQPAAVPAASITAMPAHDSPTRGGS